MKRRSTRCERCRVVFAMVRSDDPFNADWVAIPARTQCPAMLVAFMPAHAATVFKIAAIELRCRPAVAACL